MEIRNFHKEKGQDVRFIIENAYIPLIIMYPYRIYVDDGGKVKTQHDISLEDEEGVDVWTIARQRFGDKVTSIKDLETGKNVKEPTPPDNED